MWLKVQRPESISPQIIARAERVHNKVHPSDGRSQTAKKADRQSLAVAESGRRGSWPRGKQIDVGLLDQLGFGDVELLHQIPSDRRPGFRGLARAENDFQFDELAQSRHLVEMDAGLTHVVQPPPLADDGPGGRTRVRISLRTSGSLVGAMR